MTFVEPLGHSVRNCSHPQNDINFCTLQKTVFVFGRLQYVSQIFPGEVSDITSVCLDYFTKGRTEKQGGKT